jgi:UDP-N-acetylmuramate dehydrogenase
MTSYRLGGPARFLAEPPDEDALAQALARANQSGLPTYVLGRGTNLLVADEGVDGLVVRLPRAGFAECDSDGMLLRVGAGHGLPELIRWSLEQGLSGLEFLAGIPGTVGAALRMNAGGRYGQIGGRVLGVSGCGRGGWPFRLRGAQCAFGYRDSALRGLLVTRCELAVEPARRESCEAVFRDILAEKSARQPLAARSAGCVFKNPTAPGLPPAGKLIEELGFKGHRVGGASVSPRHANFLLCEGRARARDVVELIRQIRGRALAERGVRLELEIAVWGVPPEALWPAGVAA